jgi:hypothetical protein
MIGPPNPSLIYIEVWIDKLDEFMLEFEQHDKLIQAGVMVVGEAAAYSLIWEWGKDLKKYQPRLKTVIGRNPDGESVLMSVQAPEGYIHINEPWYWDIVEEEMAKVKFSTPNARQMTLELEAAAKRISKKMAEVISNSAPIDSGTLRSEIKPVDPNDPILDAQPRKGKEWKTLVL